MPTAGARFVSFWEAIGCGGNRSGARFCHRFVTGNVPQSQLFFVSVLKLDGLRWCC